MQHHWLTKCKYGFSAIHLPRPIVEYAFEQSVVYEPFNFQHQSMITSPC
jgi:hypothetical protein